MDPLVFSAILAAAAMHAGWNAVVKIGLDRFASILLLALVQSGIALVLLPWFAVPAPAAWPWLVASAFLHSGYKIFLIRAYAHGDLSQVYPLARGAAPMMVALAGAWALDEALGPAKAAAVAAIAGGVALMAFKGGAGVSAVPPRAFLYALATAAFTAAYTMVDGIGARLAGTASGFTLWLFVGDGLVMAAYAFTARGPAAFAPLASSWRSGLVAGALSLGSYWIAIWAFTMAPIALVAALRETSVLFAVAIAAVFLQEPVGRWRWLAASLIVAGIAASRVG